MLNLNPYKIQFNVSCKNSENPSTEVSCINIVAHIIPASMSVKHVGLFIDRNVSFQNEVKAFLRKLACGIKTLITIRRSFPIKTRFLIMNSLVLSFVIILIGTTTVFYRLSSPWNIKHEILVALEIYNRDPIQDLVLQNC